MAGGHKPGSSFRCDECKKRRKKCDLQQPQCLRCRQSGIRCSGPKAKAAVFVNRHTDAFSSQTQRQALSVAYKDREVAQSQNNPEDFYRVTFGYVEELRSMVAGLYSMSSLSSNNTLISSHAVMVLPTYAALLKEFKEAEGVGIFSGDRFRFGGSKHYSSMATCIRSLLPLASLHVPILDHCIVSLLALYYGRLHGDAGLVSFARSSYTTALNEFSRHIRHAMFGSGSGGKQPSPVLIFLSMALQLFEHLNDVSLFGEGQLAHINGALTILQLSDPHMIQSSIALRQAFSGLRNVAIFVAIDQRKPTFLCEPQWMTVPFEATTKSARDSLTDLALDIPSILNSTDLILDNFGSSGSDASRLVDLGLHLINEIANLQRRFDEWLYRLKKSSSSPLYWLRSQVGLSARPNSNSSGDDECKPTYTNGFHQLLFLGGPIAGLLAHLWSFQLELYMASIDLQLALQHSKLLQTSSTMSSGLSQDRATAEETAQFILETQPYLTSCFEGLLCFQAPLRILARYFDNYSTTGRSGQRPSNPEVLHLEVRGTS